MTAATTEDPAIETAGPLALRGWIELSLSQREKKMLATGLLSVGILGGDVDQAIALAFKMGVGDLVEEQAKRMGDLAEQMRFPP